VLGENFTFGQIISISQNNDVGRTIDNFVFNWTATDVGVVSPGCKRIWRVDVF